MRVWKTTHDRLEVPLHLPSMYMGHSCQPHLPINFTEKYSSKDSENEKNKFFWWKTLYGTINFQSSLITSLYPTWMLVFLKKLCHKLTAKLYKKCSSSIKKKSGKQQKDLHLVYYIIPPCVMNDYIITADISRKIIIAEISTADQYIAQTQSLRMRLYAVNFIVNNIFLNSNSKSVSEMLQNRLGSSHSEWHVAFEKTKM